MDTPSAITADAFFSPAEVLPDAPDLPPETPAALERLGPSPFPKSGFPFLGFLATVYDHVASHVGPRPSTDAAPGAGA